MQKKSVYKNYGLKPAFFSATLIRMSVKYIYVLRANSGGKRI